MDSLAAAAAAAATEDKTTATTTTTTQFETSRQMTEMQWRLTRTTSPQIVVDEEEEAEEEEGEHTTGQEAGRLQLIDEDEDMDEITDEQQQTRQAQEGGEPPSAQQQQQQPKEGQEEGEPPSAQQQQPPLQLGPILPIPLDTEPNPDKIFAGKVFCFALGKARDLEAMKKAVIRRGAIIKPHMRTTVNFVITVEDAQNRMKLNKAVEMQRLHDIKILKPEFVWACVREGKMADFQLYSVNVKAIPTVVSPTQSAPKPPRPRSRPRSRSKSKGNATANPKPAGDGDTSAPPPPPPPIEEQDAQVAPTGDSPVPPAIPPHRPIKRARTTDSDADLDLDESDTNGGNSANGADAAATTSAFRIGSLEAENERLTRENKLLRNDIMRLAVERDELQQALEAFARQIDAVPLSDDENAPLEERLDAADDTHEEIN